MKIPISKEKYFLLFSINCVCKYLIIKKVAHTFAKAINGSLGFIDMCAKKMGLKNNEINNFSAKENFSKNKPITDWEKLNTLDC